MARCDCQLGRLSPLGGHDELTFPWLGVAVLGHDWEDYGEAREGQWLERIPGLLAMNHSVIHFTQTLGCPALHDHGLRMVNSARAVVNAPEDAAAAAWFATQVEFLSAPDDSGLSRWDLMEAAADVEARRMLTQVSFSSRPSPSPAFDRLAGVLGADDTDDLCSLLTFVALMTDAPGEMLMALATAAARDPADFKRRRAADLLEALEMGETLDGYWDSVSAGSPVNSPYIVDPLRAAMQRLGRSLLLEALARPSAYLNELGEPELRSLFPPVMVIPSRAGGLIHHLSGVALEDGGRFAGDALADAALYGAARQLALEPEPAYCRHGGCPHRRTGLCRTWFDPPDAETGHDACRFVGVFAHYAGADPATVWSRRGA